MLEGGKTDTFRCRAETSSGLSIHVTNEEMSVNAVRVVSRRDVFAAEVLGGCVGCVGGVWACL